MSNAHSKNVLKAPVRPNKMMIAKPMTKGGVMIGRTDKIRIAFLALKFVLAISKANAKPKKSGRQSSKCSHH